MLKHTLTWFQLRGLRHQVAVILVMMVLLLSGLLVQPAKAQSSPFYESLIQLKLNQPLPDALKTQAESTEKRSEKQTYYFLSGNYVYPHFVETQHGLVVHVAVYVDASKVGEYTQKLQKAGSPEVLLPNTENETVYGYPSQGMVFVVNRDKVPVVYEWMPPRTQQDIVNTYDTNVVLAAADQQAQAEEKYAFMQYPTQVVEFAVGFYTALIENPTWAMAAVGLVAGVVIVWQIVRTTKATMKQQRDAEIARLMEETVAINRQREVAALVTDTVQVPQQVLTNQIESVNQPLFDVGVIEAAPVMSSPPEAVESASTVAAPEPQPTISPYQLPDASQLAELAVHNPQLQSEGVDQDEDLVAKPSPPQTVLTESEEGNVVAQNEETTESPATMRLEDGSSDSSPTT